jgi:rare lipoprotein A
MLFLSACSSSSLKLEKEPVSKYGNMDSYSVFGKKYYTMHTSKGYNQIGEASWYGENFHGKLTSSREKYNMYEMSAAHKTLPLPSYAEVTNLKNNKTIIVRVNDRGPFHGNRIIDLSYQAAKKLDMVNDGVARVKVKAVPPYQNK